MATMLDDGPCKVRIRDGEGADGEESEEEEETEDDASPSGPSSFFQTFDPFDAPPLPQQIAVPEPVPEAEEAEEDKDVPARSWASFDPFDTAAPGVAAPKAKAKGGNVIDGPPPGIMGLGSQPMHVGGSAAAVPSGVPSMPPGQQYPPVWPMYYGVQQQQAFPSQASREEVDALLLEKTALEAENAALRAHMALEAERAGAMVAMNMASIAMAQQAAANPPKQKKAAKAARDAAAPSDGKAEDGTAAKCAPAEVVPDETFHTLMLRNLPSSHGFSRDMLMGLLDREGFKAKYDFVYAPIDFHTERLMGFAFCNLVNHEEALRAKERLDGFGDWGVQSKKVCEVRWGDPGMQGLQANIEHYRNSPVMHESVPEQYRPVVLADGVIQEFAPPTKKVRAPRLRHSGARKQ